MKNSSKQRSVRILVPMAADGVGPSQVAVNFHEELCLLGADCILFTNRLRGRTDRGTIRASLPSVLNRIPYRLVGKLASSYTEAHFLETVTATDIAWLWPSASVTVYRELARRGVFIYSESINTKTEFAKRILDREYQRLDLEPGHGISKTLIEEENAKLAYANSVFAPSKLVEQSLIEAGYARKVVSTSYGVGKEFFRVGSEKPIAPSKIVYLFCGYACVRKGVHRLLEIWSRMPKNAILRICGAIEPAIRKKYANIIKLDNVEHLGFNKDVKTHYHTADVFVLPSLEEGDPLVTYEAAMSGLPVLATTAGAGRIGSEHQAVIDITEADENNLLEMLLSVYQSAELRAYYADQAQKAALEYLWHDVAKSRYDKLQRN